VTVKSQEDIERVVGVPMLGVVPEVDPEDLKTLASDVERNLYVHARPRSQVAEHLRSVRTNVMFRTAAVKGTRTLLITSASPREGKSFTSCNLAAIIAMTGHRVLLIDADLRRPAVHKRFGLDNVNGLEGVLRGDGAPADAVRHTHIRNLDVIVAGPPPQNPGELLGGEAMVNLVRGFTEYDVVLVDTPPVNVVADPLLLASAVDGVLVVVEANRTDRNLVAQASVRLREMKANVLGVIINKLSSKGSSSYSYGYGYNYYYNTYGYYYAEDEEDPEKAPARVG
jgi:capsular exopolysaccharide synthesis family protein